jgi:uncharacterized protein YkwD
MGLIALAASSCSIFNTGSFVAAPKAASPTPATSDWEAVIYSLAVNATSGLTATPAPNSSPTPNAAVTATSSVTPVVEKATQKTGGLSLTPISPESHSPTPFPNQAAPNKPSPTATPTPSGVQKGNPTPVSPAQPTPTPTTDNANAANTGQPANAAPTLAIATGCEDKAAFYEDVTIPDETMFRQGTHFTKTWRLQNAGTCAWGAKYALVSAGGDLMNGPQSMPMPDVAPGQIFNLSVDLVAPVNGGAYTGDWEFQRPDGSHFGVNSGGIDFIWAKIQVSFVVVDPGTGAAAAPASCAVTTNDAYYSQILTLINTTRANAGLKALTLQAKLSAAAQVHSQDMACSSRLDHTGMDGYTWYTRIQAQGYNYVYASENIFAGSPGFSGDPQGAFDWWMASKIHHDNNMNPKVSEIGIGYAFYQASQYGGYYTLDFALPKQ